MIKFSLNSIFDNITPFILITHIYLSLSLLSQILKRNNHFHFQFQFSYLSNKNKIKNTSETTVSFLQSELIQSDNNNFHSASFFLYCKFIINFHPNKFTRWTPRLGKARLGQESNNGTGDHDPADYHGRSEGRRVSIAAADLIGASLIYPHVNERN